MFWIGFPPHAVNAGVIASAKTGLFTKDPYGVLVVVSKDDKNGVVANYTVTYTKAGS